MQNYRTQNIVHYLRERESGLSFLHYGYNQLFPLNYERKFYKCITPNLSVQNIETPFCYMRKFTPDGKKILSFSHDQRSLIVWQYNGVARAASLLRNERRERILATDINAITMNVREFLFHRLFSRPITVRLATDDYARYHLHREFSIFLDNGRFVLLAGMGVCQRMLSVCDYWRFADLYDDVEVFSYAFFLVDLECDEVCDIINCQSDCITLSHNHGVAAYGKTIAILSKYKQCITLYELINRKFVKYTVLGPFDDFESSPLEDNYASLFTILPLTHLKQRILTYMFLEIWNIELPELKQRKLLKFFQNFRKYEKMIIEKMQFLDSENLLIRFEERPGIAVNVNSLPSDFRVYVFYSLTLDKVLKIYNEDSTELLYMIRNYCDYFCNVRSQHSLQSCSSPGNSEHFRNSFNNAVASIPGGVSKAALRFNPTIPVSTQSYSVTYYLNYNLFDYDDRLISALERPKISSTSPIRFCDRITNFVKFRIFLDTHPEHNNLLSRELVAFIIHPYEPFIISLQKLNSRYAVNFHLYNPQTVVAK